MCFLRGEVTNGDLRHSIANCHFICSSFFVHQAGAVSSLTAIPSDSKRRFLTISHSAACNFGKFQPTSTSLPKPLVLVYILENT